MKLALLAAAAVAAAALTTGTLAFAAEPPTCADALTTFQDATKAADSAAAADKAASDAKAADDALADAKSALSDARTAAINGGVASENLTATFAAALRKERTDLLAIAADDRTDAQVKRLAELEKQLPLVDAFLAAQTKLAAATTLADATDADALRREAAKTDADALAKSATTARQVADDACKGAPGVTVTPLPAPPVVAVPVPSGIDTGRS